MKIMDQMKSTKEDVVIRFGSLSCTLDRGRWTTFSATLRTCSVFDQIDFHCSRQSCMMTTDDKRVSTSFIVPKSGCGIPFQILQNISNMS